MWAQHLRNQNFPVVEFNAWETDFSEEPFIALSAELTEGLKEYADGSMSGKVEVIKEKTKEVTRSLILGIIKAAAAGVPLIGSEVGQALASLVEEKLNAYEEARKSIKMFRSALQDMANTLSKSKEGRPLVVVIDELDRCRPSYAVELLEVAKHIFAADHVVFVLGVNRSQLAHSVKALYGNEFDASGYLGRFFDLDFRLPEPDRTAFINAILADIRIDNYFKKTQDRQVEKEAPAVRNFLLAFFGAPDLSLRRVAQAIHHLGLVFASLRGDQRSFLVHAIVAMILRTIDSGLYHQFIAGEVSDLEVVDAVFKRAGIRYLKGTNEGDWFEIILIMATHQRSDQLTELSFEHSPLLKRYHDLKVRYGNADRTGSGSYPESGEHAAEFIRMVEGFHSRGNYSQRFSGFKESVQRIELLSADLIDTHT